MNKKLFLAALLVAVMTSFNVVFADSVEIGNIIASETDSDAPVTSEITNVKVEDNTKTTPLPTQMPNDGEITSEITNVTVEGNIKTTPLPTQTPDDGNVTAEISNITVLDNGSFQVPAAGLLRLMAANEESTGDKLVTVTFDLKNSSVRAAEFDIYSGVYDENNVLCSVVKKPEKFEAGEKRSILLNLNVPNTNKNLYGKLFVWDGKMKPSCNAVPFNIIGDNPITYPDVTISSNLTANTDLKYNNLTLNAYTLDLNGHNVYVNGNLYLNGGSIEINQGTLTVNGDIIQSNGSMIIGNGSLIANKDYRIQTESEEYGKIVYSYSSGILNMTHEDDRVLVNGDFYTQSSQDHTKYLTNGVLELKGNFNQLGTYSSNMYNFNASKNHKVILSGVSKQNIHFDAPTYSGFANLEIKNNTFNNITMDNGIKGWKLSEDVSINGDLKLTGGSLNLNTHNMTINGKLYLSGGSVEINQGTLTVNGDIIQSNGSMIIGNGSLIANKDYRIQTESEEYGKIVYSNSSGILNMTHEDDRVLVNGDFYTQSSQDHTKYLTNGVLELKGNFSQFGTAYSSNPNYNSSGRCFNASNNHKVILSGIGKQNIHFDAPTDSGFANLEIKNNTFNNITMDNGIKGWKLSEDVSINGDLKLTGGSLDLNTHNMTINGKLYLSGGSVEINQGALTVNDDIIQSNGSMIIGNGSLIANKDYRIQTQSEKYGKIDYSDSSGILNMTHQNDRVLVNGDFYMQSRGDHRNYLTNGVFEVKGNFTQIGTSNYSGYSQWNFNATESHKVILSGEGHQNISFDSTVSHFNTLILTKPYETGYTFSRVPCWNTLYQADAVSVNYGGQSGAYAPTGNYSQEFTDMTALSPAGDVAIKRTYNSQDTENSVFNQGWTLSICARLTDEGNGYKKIKLPDGSTCTFSEKNGAYEAQDSRHTLTKNEDGSYALKSKSMVEYRFSADGKIQAMIDRYGNTTRFETNANGDITVMTEPSGKRYTFSYSDGKLTSIRDESAGTAIAYEYTNGRLSKTISPSGVCTYFDYDGNGLLCKISDHDGNLVNAITYDSDKRVSSLTDENGNKSSYTYDMAQGKTTITDSWGRQKVQWYDSTFNVTKNQDAEGGITSTEYNMTNGMNRYNEQRTVTDRNGRNTYYERDDRGNITRQSNPDGSYKLYTYDEFNNIIKERDENGNYTYSIYDESGVRLLKQIKPLDGVSEYSETANQEDFAVTAYEYYGDEYAIKGLIKSKTEPEGRITEFTYYDNGMLKTSTVKDSKDKTSATTEYHYNAKGLTDYEIAPDGTKTVYEYDSDGNIRKLTTGKASSVIEYDNAGRKIKEISPAEYTKSGASAKGQTYTYYPSGKIKSKTDALGNTIAYTYDLYGNLTLQTNPDGSAYKYIYDGIGRKTKEYFKDKSADDFALTNEYSYSVDSGKNSQTTEKIWLDGENSVTTVNTIDFRENLVQQLRADGTSISKSYDSKGNIISETDANGNTKEYAYNALDKVIREKIPFDTNYQYKKYTYDAAGNKLSEEITNQASGQAEKYALTKYTYNSRGMLTSAAGYDNGKIKSAAQYVYDKSGNKVRVYTGLSELLAINGIDDVTPNGDNDYAVRKYEYDFLGNVTKAVDALGNSEMYSYDENGNRISYTDRNGNTISYTYDSMNNLTGKSVQGSSYRYMYDSMGNKTAVDGDYHAKYSYDSKRNLLTETADGYVKSYTYDLQGNTTSFNLSYNGSDKIKTQYSYDNMARLSAVCDGENEIAKYTYDNNGNRSSVTYDNGIAANYSFNKANLITSVKDNHNEYTYDYYMNGQQKSKTENGITESYVYDDLGRLTAAGDVTYTYDDYNNRVGEHTYDKNGRIIGYTYDKNGNLISDGTHNYTYDKWNRLTAADEEKYSYDDMNGRIKAGNKTVINNGSNIAYITNEANEQIYQNGASPIYSVINGEKNYFGYNGHGDVTELTNSLGELKKSYSYDVFGAEKNIDSADENPLRYAGQFYDTSSGNYYMSSRYYDTNSGRFLSQDSFYGNDEDILSLNQYTYCYNDPIRYVDLSGNSVVSVATNILTDNITKAGKDTLKEFFKNQADSVLGKGKNYEHDYFGMFFDKAENGVIKSVRKKTIDKFKESESYSIFDSVIKPCAKNVIEEFNSSQKENREFNMGNAVYETASGVVLSYIKSAPGVGDVYDMCLDLNNGNVFKNAYVKTIQTTVDAVAKNTGYTPINWNAGKEMYKHNSKQFTSDYNRFKSKGWSSNTSYWYALSQSYSRKVQRGNSWLKKNGYIK